MIPPRSLAIAGLAGLASLVIACASSSGSGTGDPASNDKATDTTQNPSAESFSYTSYPAEARTDRGRLGPARSGTLIAASTDAEISVDSTWTSGASVVVFYRGHW